MNIKTHNNAHRVLADRICQRDLEISQNRDRIKYVFIDACKPKAFWRAWTPEFIIDNKLKIDYTYYVTNQLMKPLQQFWPLVPIENIGTKRCHQGIYKGYRSNGEPCEWIMRLCEMQEKYCSVKGNNII